MPQQGCGVQGRGRWAGLKQAKTSLKESSRQQDCLAPRDRRGATAQDFIFWDCRLHSPAVSYQVGLSDMSPSSL